MTTQTEVTNTNQVVRTPLQITLSIWPLILAALLILTVISAVILVTPPKAEEISSNSRALVAMSARYQGLADLHAANSPVSKRALDAASARYQGMADAYLSEQAEGIETGWSATAARYQALAEYHLTRDQ